jgi:hypothetical protein
MKCDRKGPCELNQLPRSIDIDNAIRLQDAQDHAVRSFDFGNLDVTLHALKFFIRVTEITGPGTNDWMETNRDSGPHNAKQPYARSDAALKQVAAQFHSLSASALCRKR